MVEHQADVVTSRLRNGDGVRIGVVADAVLCHAARIARHPVGGNEVIGVWVVVAHQSQIVETGVGSVRCCGEPDNEFLLRLAVVGHEFFGQGELNVVEAAAVAAFHAGRNLDVGNLLTVDGERSLASTVGSGEAAEDAQLLGDAFLIK